MTCFAVETPSSAVIVIPGYLGSALRHKVTKKRVFVQFPRILLNRPALSLYQDTLGTPPGPEVEADGILGSVTVIPRFYKNIVYDALINRLQSLSNAEVVGFGYDWREDPIKAVQSLSKLIDQLHSDGVQRIDIVAHSGGGLVAAYYLGYGTQSPETAALDWAGAKKINNVVFLGTPFRGGFKMFENIFRGVNRSLIRRMFPAEAAASYPANYSALPMGLTRFYDWDGQPVDIDLRNADFWKDWKLGLLAPTELPQEVQDNRVQFVTEQLSNGRRFMDLIQFSQEQTESAPPIRILSVVGHGIPTPNSVYYRKSDCATELLFDTDNPAQFGLSKKKLRTDGDGIVTIESSKIPGKLGPLTDIFDVVVDHKGLITDPEVAERVVKFLTQAQ